MSDRITTRRTARRALRLVRTVADAVRSVVAPAALVTRNAAEEVPDPADVFTPEEMPSEGEIAEAAADYHAAADQARAADRGKRRSRKLLDRLPAGMYGSWNVERVPSSRQTPDLEEIRATYKALGLGPVPMKPCAPSLRVTDLSGAQKAGKAAEAPAAVPVAA
ncbi:hypothetical protein [Kitasatospora sp. A2-31]|uniref:hypothetical protein n=1 Tax=Kitasatospora sp. A2-31 TaxID=2916414 RepID=UPI001EEAA561|nr:hypothetical protein [Kitasatospora sp. A2-31]MCG6496647.1 hypothetical protein [Kitasatospora sp. A2-31]